MGQYEYMGLTPSRVHKHFTDSKALFAHYSNDCYDNLHDMGSDGNFLTEHMKHQSREQDVSLSAGMAFMANPDSYQAHLQSGQEYHQVSKQ